MRLNKIFQVSFCLEKLLGGYVLAMQSKLSVAQSSELYKTCIGWISVSLIFSGFCLYMLHILHYLSFNDVLLRRTSRAAT